MSRYWLLGLSLLCTTASYAEESVQPEQNIDVPNPLQTEVEFGYQAHTGNTDSRSLNARLSAEYTSGRHRSNGEWKYYNLYKDGEEDKRSSTYSVQSDYKLGPKTYLYGSFKGVDSRYSAYFKDYTLSGGLGYQFSYTENFILEAEIGLVFVIRNRTWMRLMMTISSFLTSFVKAFSVATSIPRGTLWIT